MDPTYPYTLYACPCSDLTSPPTATPHASKRASLAAPPPETDTTLDQPLDPHDPRANFALFPLDRLLFCDECEAVRCERCWAEEVLYWYCPSCLFDVRSSAVRGDGCRCSRSCYNCPCCEAPLAVTQVKGEDDGLLKPGGKEEAPETYILHCGYCEWSTLEIGVRFGKATKITEQLAKQRKARMGVQEDRGTPSREGEGKDGEREEPQQRLSHEARFKGLSRFYQEQLSESGDSQNPYAGGPYSSPAHLARIMSMYGSGLSYDALKKSREKPQPMREALAPSEGLATYTPHDPDPDAAIIARMRSLGWEGTTTSTQRLSTPANGTARFAPDLWPIATPLRTRRGKRCRTCRQFLARPEPRVGSMRYRIRLLAMHHVPRLTLKPLHAQLPPSNPAFHLRAEPLEAAPKLRPLQTRQYVLTVANPVFESVRVTLATPAVTPGRVASKVTILCPSFTVGPAGEVWDDALESSEKAAGAYGGAGGGRSAAMASLTRGAGPEGGSGGGGGERQPEAGKVWEATRNSTSVVLEIVPGALRARPGIVPGQGEGDEVELGEDEDVLEVPVYVRAEWEVELKPGETGAGKAHAEKEVGEKVRKEVGGWVVLGVGRIGE